MKQLNELIPELSNGCFITEGISGISYADLPAKMEELGYFFNEYDVRDIHFLGVELSNNVNGVLVLLYLLLNDINFYLLTEHTSAGATIPAFCDKVLRMKTEVSSANDNRKVIGKIIENADFTNEPGRHPAGSGTVIFSSSGTSGPAKYICFRSADLLHNARNCIKRFCLTTNTKVLVPVPLNHMYGLGAGLLPALLAGASITLLNKSNVIRLIEVINEVQPDLTFITPTLCRMVLTINKDFKTMGRFISAGERLHPETILQFTKKYGPLINLYGCTEMGVIATASHDALFSENGLTDLIRPLDGVQIMLQGSATEGEILVKHNAGFCHYMDKRGVPVPADPSDNGWYRTRDLGSNMGNDCFKVMGRIDYCINRNGFLVPLQEIESSLIGLFPGIEQVIAVTGDGDVMSGASLIAICELGKGEKPDAETARKVCLSKMPRHLVPDEFRFIQKMPRLGNGKPDRNYLSKNYKLIIMQSAILDEIKLKLKKIIVEDLNVNIPIEEIEDDMSLYEDGIGLDSIVIVNFIVRIESRFNISFEDSEINSKLFSNLNSLADFIMSKTGETTGKQAIQ